jgi:hypothetical protein
MVPRQPLRIIRFVLLFALLGAVRAMAQSPVDPSQLPGRTSFYLLWRGTPTGEVRAKNSVYGLWDDPDFAPARSAFFASMLSQSQKQKDKPPALSPDEAKQYATLLDNPYLVGYLRRPESAPPAAPAAPAAAKSTTAPKAKPAWNGMFFVYDRTGKEELLSKAVVRLRGSETDIPKLTPLTVAGVPALKVERKDSTTYWAEFGKYAVSAQEQSVFEEILNLLNGKTPASNLSQSAAFVEAKPLLSGGLVEFFLNVSNLKELAMDSSGDTSAQFKPFLAALKLDSLHSVAGHLSLEGQRTRIQAAILGDTAPGSLFDLFADGQNNPASLGLVSPETLYYSESQLDLLGLYKFLKRAIMQGSANPSQQVDLLETAANTRLGMPLADALGVTTGEFASIQTSPSFDKNQQVYYLGIRNKESALKLARSLMGDRISSEHNEGNATFLKISLQGGQSSSGVAQWNFYYLAMTQTALLGASQTDVLHKYLGLSSSGADPAAPKSFQAARAQFPEKLNGLTYVDLQKLDWAALKAKWIAEAEKSAQAAKSTDASTSKPTDASKTPQPVPSWLNLISPDVIPRHLRTVAGASWKDTKGVHFDEWIE